MSKCENCEYSKIDDVLGEYRCVKEKQRLYSPEKVVECPRYKKEKGRVKTDIFKKGEKEES